MLILFLKAAILIPITLLPILNPFGNAPVLPACMAISVRLRKSDWRDK
jgi:multiple antibiotic resistance protein